MAICSQHTTPPHKPKNLQGTIFLRLFPRASPCLRLMGSASHFVPHSTGCKSRAYGLKSALIEVAKVCSIGAHHVSKRAVGRAVVAAFSRYAGWPPTPQENACPNLTKDSASEAFTCSPLNVPWFAFIYLRFTCQYFLGNTMIISLHATS